MASNSQTKKMQVTFSEENEDLYNYLKQFRYPSEIVCKALRAFIDLELNKSSTDALHDTIKKQVLSKDILDSIAANLNLSNVQAASTTEDSQEEQNYDAVLSEAAKQFELD